MQTICYTGFMKVGSLFSGIGGLEYGLERSGLVSGTEWMVEMDPYCCEVLRKNYPNTMILEQKIEDIDPSSLSKIDLLTAGFPCQPVSTAGKRKGVEDERWLWDEVWRFIDVLRPRYFILENVPGLLTANKGKAFERVITDISKSRLYNFEWTIVSAKSIGAPHLRKRFFGVGSLANANDSGYGTHRAESQREWEESDERRQEQSLIESSRQSSSSELGNSEHIGSSSIKNRGGIGERSLQGGQGEEVQEIINREFEGESEISREEAELWMGNSSYGFPRWMVRLGMKNVWSSDLQFPTAAARDWKDTYGTVETGSKTSKRKTLPLEIFRNMRDQIKDFALWEYGMPRTMEDYDNRTQKLKALGNAVVPECAELVGRLLKRSIEEDTIVFDSELLR